MRRLFKTTLVLAAFSLLGACASRIIDERAVPERDRVAPAYQALSDEQLEERLASFEGERAQADADYAAAEFVCWKKFAVNACLSDANAKRRQLQASIKEHELAIKTEQRQRRALSTQERLNEKAAAQPAPAASSAASGAL